MKPGTILVNGDERPLAPRETIATLLEDLALDVLAVAVEYNGAIVRRPAYEATLLRDGDRLEIVRFVQGG